ncbi:putative E3 ubiquitin-protein ligase UBR7 [Dermacentor andersoni]|uniref:putative E3 ubiquitin-protein ligase UBR7 n=1 Tax=Dermacentor andersoni TaxID=34620 RepID=UPI002155EC68|nr:putative E3 ubiquitin-protein ligase UBR7 [Dermacentor andersoni]
MAGASVAGVMADDGKISESAPSTSIDLQDENSVTLQDVLDEAQELEDDADAVLGGSDDKNCTYDQGYIKRQALYACGTCTGPDSQPAGVCLACSYACHEGHNLYELYTKRNFRCDCGNASFPANNPCRLCPRKAVRNDENKYNHNFHGVYCTCKRPYPDPDDDVEDEMLQCVVCEDWYHGRHIGGEVPANQDDSVGGDTSVNHGYCEVVCNGCMSKHPFLRWYLAHELSLLKKDASLCEDAMEKKQAEGSSSALASTAENGVKVEGSVENGVATSHENGTDAIKEERPNQPTEGSSGSRDEVKVEKPAGRSGLLSSVSQCILERLRSSVDDVKEEPRNECAYWPSGWRSRLCHCIQCLAMYNEQHCLFLLDEEDTVHSYEEKGKAARAQAPAGDPLMSALGTLGRVQQIEAIHGYNNLKTELVDFLKKFADNRKVVREEDVREFFSGMEARKRRKTSAVPYFCR